jgi:hypothetical protein
MTLATKLALVPIVLGGIGLVALVAYLALVAWLDIGDRTEAAREGREEWLP